MLDYLLGDGFNTTALTAIINKVPMVPTQLGDMGLFEVAGLATTHADIESQDGKLALVEDTPRGGPGETIDSDKRKLVRLVIPHFQRDDTVMADEVQNIRAFGEEAAMETIEARIAAKMGRHTRDFDLTGEHLRHGAVNGIVLGKSGRVLFDPFTAFGIAQPASVNFALGTSTTDLKAKCTEVIERMEDALEYAGSFEVHGLAGAGFHKQFQSHAKVEKAWENWEGSSNRLADGTRRPFEFGDIHWHRSRTRAKARKALGNAPLIADDEVRFVAVGVPELFIERYGPADYIETVNTMGLPRYAKRIVKQNGKGVDLEMQTNCICACTNPASLIRGTAA